MLASLRGGFFLKAKKLIIAITIGPLLTAAFLYASGFISQFIANYQAWESVGNFAGNGSSPVFPSSGFWDCLKAVFVIPYGLYGILICVLVIALLCIFVFHFGRGGNVTYDRERNLEYSSKGTYGTSGYMTEKEMEKVLETVKNPKNTTGTILGIKDGKVVCVPQSSRMNRNIAVYGASGSMKSRAFARNMIFQCVKRGESLIITDPKSELYESMSQYLRNNGYEVKVFNLVNPENSDSWNCLSEVEGQEIMAQLFCDVIIKNTGSARGDHFWDNSELNILKALVLYVDHGYPPEKRNIGEVYKLLSLSSERELNALFDPLPISHPAKSPYSIFQQASDSVRGGIIIGLGSRIQVFQNEIIRKITSYNEIDLSLPGKKKCAYFCVTSDQDSTFDFLSSLFLTFIFIKLVRFADKHGDGGVLPVPVHILADELANIGIIPDLTKKISTVRSRGISISVIFQSVAQMKNRYPLDQWQEILGNCDTQLFLGCTDEVTAKYISDRTGEITIGVSSEAKQLNTWRVSNYTPEYRETRSTGKRKLLTPDEVLRFPLNEALIILRGQKVLRIDKFDYEQHPESKKLIPQKAKYHIPDWQKETAEKDTMVTVPEERPVPVPAPAPAPKIKPKKPEPKKQTFPKKINTPKIQPPEVSKPTETAGGFYIDEQLEPEIEEMKESDFTLPLEEEAADPEYDEYIDELLDDVALKTGSLLDPMPDAVPEVEPEIIRVDKDSIMS